MGKERFLPIDTVIFLAAAEDSSTEQGEMSADRKEATEEK